MSNEIGSIEVGKRADIVMLDMDNVLTEPHLDLVTNLVHNAYNSVCMTMVDGNVLMKDRELLLDIDEKDLINVINSRIKNY